MTRSCTISGTATSLRMPGMGLDIARVLGDVAHQDGPSAAGGGARDAFVEAHAGCLGAFVIAKAETAAQYALALVEQQDHEGVVVDQFLDRLGDPVEQGVELEDGGELLPEQREGSLRPVLALNAPVEPGILDRRPDAGGDQLQQGPVLGSEDLRGGRTGGRSRPPVCRGAPSARPIHCGQRRGHSDTAGRRGHRRPSRVDPRPPRRR
jgi:hypothetical protein